MGIFDKLRKEKMPTKKEISESIDKYNQLLNTDLAEIWNIDDTNSFVIAMTGRINEKCGQNGTTFFVHRTRKTVPF